MTPGKPFQFTTALLCSITARKLLTACSTTALQSTLLSLSTCEQFREKVKSVRRFLIGHQSAGFGHCRI
jgi:hypothetical protein